MDYRETILEVTQRFLSKPVEPGIGLLGMTETSSRLLVRLKWLEKMTWKYRGKYRGLRIVTVCAVVALMVAGVLPMAKAKKGEAAITSEEIEADKSARPIPGEDSNRLCKLAKASQDQFADGVNEPALYSRRKYRCSQNRIRQGWPAYLCGHACWRF